MIRENEKPQVIILCGGLGTRFQKVSMDFPKALAPIGDKLFLDVLIEQFLRADYDRFILCTGHLSHKIVEHFKDHPKNTEIIISEEPQRRGTAGAIKHAEPFIQSEHFFVVNGDSYCDVPLQNFYQSHRDAASFLSVAIAPPDLRHDTGNIVLEEKTNRVLAFYEKTQGVRHSMNTGIYIFTKSILEKIPENKTLSLEHEFFPSLIEETFPFYGFYYPSKLIDVGTPERYEEALQYFKVL